MTAKYIPDRLCIRTRCGAQDGSRSGGTAGTLFVVTRVSNLFPWRPIGTGQQFAGFGIALDDFRFHIPLYLAPYEH